MVGWHHWVDGHEFEQAPGVGDGQGSLACCSPQGHKESDTTEQLNWTDRYSHFIFYFHLHIPNSACSLYMASLILRLALYFNQVEIQSFVHSVSRVEKTLVVLPPNTDFQPILMFSHLTCPCPLFQAATLRWEHLSDSVTLIDFLFIHISVMWKVYPIPSSFL